MPLLNFFAIVILSVENKILLQEKMKELRRLRTRYQPGKENASKNKADTQLAIANRIIQQSNQTKETPKVFTLSVMSIH